MFTEIGPGVFVVEHRVAEGKNGIVFGARGALAIDVGIHPDEGQAMADFIRSKGYQPSRVVITHGHSDHVLGGRAFAGAEVFAHAETPHEMRRTLGNYAERKALSRDELLDQALWPTVTFSDELYIDLGDRSVRVFRTPGHCPDHTSVYLDAERILLAGDCVVTGIVPAIGDGDSDILEATLQKLLRLPIEILVAGHGPVIHGKAQVDDWLTWLTSYLRGIRAVVLESLRRDPLASPEAVAETVDFPTFVGDRLPADKHGMTNRHRNTVLKIIDEQRRKIGLGPDADNRPAT